MVRDGAEGGESRGDGLGLVVGNSCLRGAGDSLGPT